MNKFLCRLKGIPPVFPGRADKRSVWEKSWESPYVDKGASVVCPTRTSRLRLFGAEAPLSLWLTVEPVVTAYVYVQQGQGQCFWAYIQTLFHDFHHFFYSLVQRWLLCWFPSLFLTTFFYGSLRNDTDFICRFSLSRLFLWVAHKSDTLFYLVVFRPDPIYIQIFWGSPKTPAYAFSGRRPWRRWLASVLACVFLG